MQQLVSPQQLISPQLQFSRSRPSSDRLCVITEHAQQCEAIAGGAEEKNALVVIQFAGTTQKGVDPNGFFETPDGDFETVCLRCEIRPNEWSRCFRGEWSPCFV